MKSGQVGKNGGPNKIAKSWKSSNELSDCIKIHDCEIELDDGYT